MFLLRRMSMLFVITIGLLVSCKTLITDDERPFGPVPVVNAILAEGDTLKVLVSLAEKIDTIKLGFVDNAQVDLYVNDEWKETLNYTSSGNYCSSTIIKSLVKYTCKVNIPGFELIECSQTIPPKPVIKKIEHINISGIDEDGIMYPAVNITFENTLQSKVYYEVLLHYYYIFKESAFFHRYDDPVILNEGLPLPLFSNEIINDSIYTIHLNYFTGDLKYSYTNGLFYTELTPFWIELRQVTEDYYRFKKQLYLFDQGLQADGIVNSMTNNNVYSNVKNALGIFAGYSSVFSDTITPNTDGYYD